MRPELISMGLCPFVQRSVITLRAKRVQFTFTEVNLERPPDWFAAISPMGKVPVLRWNNVALFESAVINEFLDESFPPSMHPSDPLDRARHRAWIEVASTLIGEQWQWMTATEADVRAKLVEAMSHKLSLLEAQDFAGPNDRLRLIDAAYAPLFLRYQLIERLLPALAWTQWPRLSGWRDWLLAQPEVREPLVPDFESRFLALVKPA